MTAENGSETMTDPSTDAAAQTPPLLSVLKGTPSPQELAALTTVVAAAAAGANAPRDEGPLDRWGDRDEALRTVGFVSFGPRAYLNGDFGTY